MVKIGGNTPPLQLNTQQVFPSAIESKDSAFTETQEETVLLESIIIPFIPLLSSIGQPQLIINVAQENSISISIPVLQDECGVDLNGADLSKDKTQAPYNPSFYPGVAWQEYYVRKAGNYIDDLSKAKVTIVEAPKNGSAQLGKERFIESHSGPRVFYIPNSGFRGVDTMAVRIELNGKSVIVKKRFVIVENVKYKDEDGIIISRFSNGSSGGGAALDKAANECIDNPKLNQVRRIGSVDGVTQSLTQWAGVESDWAGYDAFDLAAWQRRANLSALIASANQSLVGFSDLASTAIGETTGQSLSAKITLDTNAAGHNWYIDPTPLDNTDDYLPTSNPDVWQAKAGSEADGKMDLLSVLLHEYGHALGLEHSANGADFMAASLQPGVRKLPSAAELTLMSQLVADLKNAGGEALTLALSQGERGQVQGESEQDPSNPFAPSPLTALGLLPFGLMRRNDGKGSANAALTTGAATASHIDYLTAINTTLANGSLHAGQNGIIDQWESVGNVAAKPANAFRAVMLGESTTAQAHLAQAFVLSAQDRFLTFTVSGLNLQTNSIEQNGVFTAAPQDAFEVALQNANTGANLLANGAGGVGNYPF